MLYFLYIIHCREIPDGRVVKIEEVLQGQLKYCLSSGGHGLKAQLGRTWGE